MQYEYSEARDKYFEIIRAHSHAIDASFSIDSSILDSNIVELACFNLRGAVNETAIHSLNSLFETEFFSSDEFCNIFEDLTLLEPESFDLIYRVVKLYEAMKSRA